MRHNDKKLLKNWASNYFLEKDFQNFDIDAEIDSSISVEENKTILEKKFKGMFHDTGCIKRAEVMSMMLPYKVSLYDNAIRTKVLKNLLMLVDKKISDVPDIMKELGVNRRSAYDYFNTLKEIGIIK